ncbi:MAG TPA: pyridoxal phosphate-dependent aminotransferase [Vicinamibacterales bacterium]|nr:pyridoxal phosphate-dependent aminotransferase [Vicinamibacterales bacterium]
MFSTRTPADLEPNALARAVAALRARGAPVLDLTETNPTRAGLAAPEALVAALGDPRSLRYDPEPFGLPAAREAVADDYRRSGLGVAAGRIALTSSTSEAYSFLFKLLCEPGDEVLVPVPSYPLFEHLTRLDAVEPRAYDLEYHGTWAIDLPSVERALTPRTRAILVVSPNNPTGSLLRRGDLEAISAIAAARELALVGDEVFADYPLEPAADGCRVLEQDEALTFALGGLSKSVGLPQLKLGWIAAAGPAPLLAPALARLEIVCDAYLSVSTPVQHAAGSVLAAGRAVREAIAGRVSSNLARLRQAAASSPCSVLRTEGGWSAVLRVPAMRGEERLVLDLLQEDGVLVHPGYFFDFPREAYVVVSLLPEPAVFTEAVSRVIARASSGP